MEKSQARIFNLDQYNYPRFRGKIIELYLHAFTTGDYAQYYTNEAAESKLDELVRKGSGNMAFIGDRLAGVLLAFSLKKDLDFPTETCPEIPVDSSIYIAELMVHTNFRGKGVATGLLNNYLTQNSHNCTDAVIRVWKENKPAMFLYQKLGFKTVATIFQPKIRATGEHFQMEKLYLHKSLQ